MTPKERMQEARAKILAKLESRIKDFKSQGKLIEAQRIEERTRFDLEMIDETALHSRGSRTIPAIWPGERPGRPQRLFLISFLDDFLLMVDESHMTIPQVRGMYNGDRARKQSLVDYGFRLPSAMDNRPLKFDEFEKHVDRALYVSATPAEYELKLK